MFVKEERLAPISQVISIVFTHLHLGLTTWNQSSNKGSRNINHLMACLKYM